MARSAFGGSFTSVRAPFPLAWSDPCARVRAYRACTLFLDAGVAVVGFVLCTIPKLHYYVLLTSTAFVGATAFMLGVDCYTTAGLKEVRALIL